MTNRKQKIVVLTGAGISAESGLKTFRDSGGLWEGYDVYEVATPEGFAKDPALVLEFYNMRRKDVLKAAPNAAHYGLAALEEQYDVTVVTQNIDDLHERAGSTNVIHLHGEILKMRSVKSYAPLFPAENDIALGDLAPDGGQLRPHVVWFGEAVPMIEKAAQEMAQADIFILVGSSLNVYPAAGLIDFVPAASPKYIIDPKTPMVQHYQHIELIEKNAVEGVKEVLERLK